MLTCGIETDDDVQYAGLIRVWPLFLFPICFYNYCFLKRKLPSFFKSSVSPNFCAILFFYLSVFNTSNKIIPTNICQLLINYNNIAELLFDLIHNLFPLLPALCTSRDHFVDLHWIQPG